MSKVAIDNYIFIRQRQNVLNPFLFCFNIRNSCGVSVNVVSFDISEQSLWIVVLSPLAHFFPLSKIITNRETRILLT